MDDNTAEMPDVKPFTDFCPIRNIETVMVFNATQPKEKEIESVAYAIRETVFQEGVKPRNVYSKAIPKLMEDISDGLSDFIVKEILRKL